MAVRVRLPCNEARLKAKFDLERLREESLQIELCVYVVFDRSFRSPMKFGVVMLTAG